MGNGYTGCLLGDLCELGTHSCHKNAVCTTTGLGEFECKVNKHVNLCSG